jgi:hypothetical protein
VARAHRVSANVVAILASRVKRNPEILSELHSRQQAKLSREQAISQVVCDLNERGEIIDKAARVSALAEQAINQALPPDSPRVKIKASEARTVMKRDHFMSYRKIKDTSIQSNSEKNLVLRQRWALEYLSLLRSKKNFLNID